MKVVWAVVGIAVFLMPPITAAEESRQEKASEDMAEMTETGRGVEWSPRIAYERMVLTISGQDVLVRREFGPREKPKLELVDERGRALPDGNYTWELRAVPKIDPAVRKRLTEIRESGDEEALREMRLKGVVPKESQLRSGYIQVRGGKLESRREEEPRREPRPGDGRRPQRVEGDLKIDGSLSVSGTKNFVVVDPEDSARRIYFAALEGPEAGTYYRGSSATVAGRVVIDLPGVFARVTEAEGLTVQLTPLNGWARLWVEEKSPDRLVVRQVEGDPPVEFDFLVQGVRKGYANYRVERAENEGILGDDRSEGGEGR